jgi:hypothetical protein
MVAECEPPAGVNLFSAVIPQRPSTRGNRIVPGITYQKIFEYMRADPRLVSGEIPSIALVDRQDTANASTRAFFEAISLVTAAPPATRPIGLWMQSECDAPRDPAAGVPDTTCSTSCIRKKFSQLMSTIRVTCVNSIEFLSVYVSVL